MHQFDLSGKTAIVTGGASGIGLAAAKTLAEAGATIALADINKDAASTAALALSKSGHQAIALGVDVASEISVEEMISSVRETTGRVDILVASAGIAIRETSTDLPLTDWEKVVAVNMTGVFLCARHAAKHMMEGEGGAIISVSSIMGLSGGGIYPNISYQSTKGALVNMTRALAIEWASYGIRVNAVAPTWVDTPLITALKSQPEVMEKIYEMTPLQQLASVDDVANAILFLASPAANMVTGHTLPVDGGFLAQ